MSGEECQNCGGDINYADNSATYLTYGLDDNYCLGCHREWAEKEAKDEAWGEYEHQSYKTLKSTYGWTGVHKLIDWIDSLS